MILYPLLPLYLLPPTTICQSLVATEESRSSTFYRIERGTLLAGLAFALLCRSTEVTGEGPTYSIPELFF